MDAPEYCAQEVRARDEDRWLAAQYAPPPLRRRLLALAAFQIQLRRIPSQVSEPPLGEIRLQWHRDALQEIRDGRPPRRHPLIEEVAMAGLAAPEFAPRFDAVIDAAARPLYGEGFTSAGDLVGWLEKAEGGFDAMAVQLAGGDEALQHAAAKAGGAFAAAREAKGMAPDIDARAEIVAAFNHAKEALQSASGEQAPALAHLVLTPLYLKKRGRPFPAMKRLRLFSAVALGR